MSTTRSINFILILTRFGIRTDKFMYIRNQDTCHINEHYHLEKVLKGTTNLIT